MSSGRLEAIWIKRARRALAPPWRGGAFAEVLDDGEIALGAPIGWVEAG